MYRMFPITFTIDRDTLDRLDRLAEQRSGGNRSALVRELIDAAFDSAPQGATESADEARGVVARSVAPSGVDDRCV